MAQKIQSHLADSQFSLKSLANDLGFSPTYLSSLIKKELGLPSQFASYLSALHFASIENRNRLWLGKRFLPRQTILLYHS